MSSEGELQRPRHPRRQQLTYRLVGEIIARFEKRGFKLVALKQLSPSKVSCGLLEQQELELTTFRSTSRSTTPTWPASPSSRD